MSNLGIPERPSLSIESAFMTDETKEQILQKADSHARSLASKAKDYTPN